MLDVGTLPCGFAWSEPLPCCWDPCVLWTVTVDPPLHFDPGISLTTNTVLFSHLPVQNFLLSLGKPVSPCWFSLPCPPVDSGSPASPSVPCLSEQPPLIHHFGAALPSVPSLLALVSLPCAVLPRAGDVGSRIVYPNVWPCHKPVRELTQSSPRGRGTLSKSAISELNKNKTVTKMEFHWAVTPLYSAAGVSWARVTVSFA